MPDKSKKTAVAQKSMQLFEMGGHSNPVLFFTSLTVHYLRWRMPLSCVGAEACLNCVHRSSPNWVCRCR